MLSCALEDIFVSYEHSVAVDHIFRVLDVLASILQKLLLIREILFAI